MKKKIAILPGDGVGPDVIEQAQKVLDAIAQRFDHQFDCCQADIGASAIQKTGSPLPDYTLDTCIQADAILFGAVGHPTYDNDPKAKVRPEQGLLKLRKALGLYANIRPVNTFPKLLHYSALKPESVRGVDFLIYRELTGGIYFGGSNRSEDGQEATDICKYNTTEIERVVRQAFERAAIRRAKLTLVDKANVLETSRLWREVVQDLAMEYSHVAVNML
ncbi:MAG: isocitrate/isopropylmalate family dehydrogenase, partial [Bacteroidota bacterium]